MEELMATIEKSIRDLRDGAKRVDYDSVLDGTPCGVCAYWSGSVIRIDVKPEVQ